MALVEARGLQKRFGSLVAIDSLSFDVDEGEVFGLLGPNGAGKTTTARLLACLTLPTAGDATVCGFKIRSEQSLIRERVGILTENPCLYERLTASENLNFFAEAYGLRDAVVRKSRIAELLDFFQLSDKRSENVAKLSKGMKQKLAIARSIIHRPRVILLDEPTSSLDPESASEVRELIMQLSRRERCGILLCTHRLEDAERLCRRVMILSKGKELATGSLDQLRRTMMDSNVVEIVLKNRTDGLVNILKDVGWVRETIEDEPHRLLVRVDDPDSSIPSLVSAIVNAGGLVMSVRLLQPSLEEVYLKLLKSGAS